ncbi:hypothetical protein [Paractinoplanes globisporus]|uniref:Uncharacterized protein n=1 Tax=Paractinoplanes globisporus TaxID=113565 RepID=A0ABW6W5U7_9ACTN|nr:hypothetical protein [Actinoplanes globisporus]
MSTVNEDRLAEVDRHVTDAANATAQRHPGFATAIRHSVDRLRGGLTLAHSRAEAVDDAAWSSYVTDLDAGLDELDKEIGRAADGAIPGTSVDDVLTIHLTGIELQGWRLQVSLPGVQPRLTAAELQLQRYASACATGVPKPAAALADAMTDLRAAA